MLQAFREPTESVGCHITLDDGSAIRSLLANSLTANGHLAGRDVGFEYQHGVVVLRGRVSTFHEKQMAQELARRVNGITMIENAIIVDRPEFHKSGRDGVSSIA